VNPRRLCRSADDRLIAGVAGGLAAYLDVDPAIVRIIWFLSILLTGTVTLWVYLIMIVVVPLEPTGWPQQSSWAPGGAPIGSEAGTTPSTADTIQGSAAGFAGSGPGAAPAAGPGAAPAAGPGAAFAGTPPPAAGGSWRTDWREQTRQVLWQQRAERDEYRAFGGPGLVLGFMLVLIGGLLAWHEFDPRLDLDRVWPVAIIVFGAILVLSSFRFRR
jgi:phage shock protein C